MNCSSCQHENPESARFCNACGSALEARCAACDQVNPAGARFCNECGASLGAKASGRAQARLDEAADPRSYTPKHLAERILTQKSALEGERKHVTVLFADLADSTALAEHVGDPEVMHALMDRAFGLMLEQVHGYEGTINQFTGDGVMALFGAPIALEDAPQQAVVAALAIQQALEALDQDVQESHGRRFRMRIGIHTGPVVVGRIGDDLRMDYTAVGDTTNLAARLQSIAQPGTVVISDDTRRLVEGYFDLEPLPPAELKGKSQSILCHRVLGAGSAGGRIDVLSEMSGLTPYVGRERELDALLDAFEEVESGRGQVAFLVGEAGLGKSRLLHEFRQRLKERKHVWIEGRCASYAQSTPFHAVADSMRRVHGIDDRDSETQILEKLSSREGMMGGELAWTLPYLRILLSMPSGDPEVDALDAMTRRAEMCRALHARLLRISESMPAVVVMEDMHWTDAATEEFLGFVADSIPTLPIMLVFTHRPGYEHPFGDRSFHNRVALRTLSEDDMSSMVDSVLETSDLPPALRKLIAEKAEGNPLFVEEVTTSLLEEGVLALENGRARLTRDLADISIPDRIQDVLMARLDRLPEEPKRAIQIASVIGREFAMRLLERIHDTGEQLEQIVGELRALELIYEKTKHPELAYIFKHALTHDVAYESVLVARRTAMHRIVGSAIEELYPDRIPEHYEALAYHFGAGEDLERALHYHELASKKSAAAYANHAAIDHCRKGTELADQLGNVEDARILALQRRLGECSWMTSDFGASAAAFVRAAELSSDSSAESLLLARAAWSFLWDHDYEKSRATVERAFTSADRSGSLGGRAFALVSGDEIDLVHGRNLEDDTGVEEALVLAERSGDPAVLVGTLGQLAQRTAWRGEYRRAIDYGERSIELAQRSRCPGDSLFATWFLAISAVCLGDYRRGLEVLGGGIALCDRIGDRAIKARLLNTMGWAHAEFGCHERAAHFNRAATELAREMVELGLVPGAPELYANGAINLAGNLIALGRHDEADETLAPIQRQYEEDPDPWMRWRWSTHLLHAQARLALARGEPELALSLAEQEVAGATSTVASKLICLAHEQMGRIRLVLEEPEEAELEIRTALTIAEGIEHASVTWRGHGLLAEIARRAGDGSVAEQHIEMMRRSFETLAPGIPEGLRLQFLTLGERLRQDPVGAHR